VSHHGRNVDCSRALLPNAAQVPSRPGIQWLALRLLRVQVDEDRDHPASWRPPQCRRRKLVALLAIWAGVRTCAVVYGDRNSSSNKLERKIPRPCETETLSVPRAAQRENFRGAARR
jgi:hypothetical protein